MPKMIFKWTTLARTALLLIAAAGTAGPANGQQARWPEKHIAPLEDGAIEYTDQGEGEAILFIHGGFAVDTFLPMTAEPALVDYRRITYARRGYAGSADPTGEPMVPGQADVAAALLDYLGIDRGHVVAHSRGGLIALELAVSHAGRVGSLVLLEGSLPAIEGSEVPEPPSGDPLGPVLARIEAGDHTGAVELWWERGLGPDWRAQLARMLPGTFEQTRNDAADFVAFDRPGNLRQAPPDYYRRINQPVLSVRGAEPKGLTPGLAGLLRKIIPALLPQAEGVDLPGLTHLMLLEDPKTTAETVADFLARHPIHPTGRE